MLYDVDPGFLLRERECAGEDTAAPICAAVCRCDARRSEKTSLLRDCTPLPFVPADAAERARRCRAILDMQAAGLRQRLLHTRAKRCVIGISGGLDSTLALLVTAQTYASLGMPASDILCITMPGLRYDRADEKQRAAALRDAGRFPARGADCRRGARTLPRHRS